MPAAAGAPSPDEATDVASSAVDVVAQAGEDEPGAPIPSRLAAVNPRFVAVVERFLGEFDARLAEMQAALDAGDHAALASAAHWLKGAGGSMGYDDLFEPSKALEEAAKAADADAAAALMQSLHALTRRIERGLPAAPAAGPTLDCSSSSARG